MYLSGHCYLEASEACNFAGKGALFLDRDGILIEDVGYIKYTTAVRLIDGAAQLVRAANDAGVPVIVVTNQSGIARGLTNLDDFQAVNQRMQDLILQDSGGTLDAIIACTALPVRGEPCHPWRKPNPGMITAARNHLGCVLHRSWIVGDRWTDIRAGRRAGLQGAFHLSQNLAASIICRNGYTLIRSNRLTAATAILKTMTYT